MTVTVGSRQVRQRLEITTPTALVERHPWRRVILLPASQRECFIQFRARTRPDLLRCPDHGDATSNDGNVNLTLPTTEYRVDVAAKKGNNDVSVSNSDSSSHIISVTTRKGDVTITPAS